MYKQISRILSDNVYLLLGLLIGFYLANQGPGLSDEECLRNSTELLSENENNLSDFQPLKIVKKPTVAAGANKKPKPIRPRYYSTELGIRKKLFVGIFTSEDRIVERAVPLNRTFGHLVDQVKFFITARYKLRNSLNLSGIVGFTETRPRYRPFQVLKYIGDNFAQEYDYYYLAQDYTFLDAHKLNDLVARISVKMDVYLGEKVPDASFCSLDGGIILSNSVLRSMREQLDWCVLHALSDDHGENLGRCVHHSIALTCQSSVQDNVYAAFKLKHFDLQRHLHQMVGREDFARAIAVYPVLKPEQIYQLNAHFLKERLSSIKQKIEHLSQGSSLWPPGRGVGAKPATRFDLPRQQYFNSTHIFHPDDFTNARQHTALELTDLNNILSEIKAQNPHVTYGKLVNGYKKFDLSRGYDYVLDLETTSARSGIANDVRRYQVCKPLGKVEFVPAVPYVTENTRLNVVVPVELSDLETAIGFLRNWVATILDRKDKSFLMLVLLYPNQASNKGDSDVFKRLKSYVLQVGARHKEEMVMAWLSIRLPDDKKEMSVESHPCLRFALLDLALRKIGLDSLVLTLDPYVNVTVDFLNRARMNTIPGWQIYSPIPFKFYDTKVTQGQNTDVHKNSGRFDSKDYDYVAFYSQDYVDARRRHAKQVPIVRSNGDVDRLALSSDCHSGNVFEMFVQMAPTLHAMRATEMSLRVTYRPGSFLGNQAQLGTVLLAHSVRIPELD